MLHKTDFISLGPEMHHCSSIAVDNGGYWIALYHGQECQDEQRVAVCYRDKNDQRPYTVTVDLEDKTGNPIVWKFQDQVYLLYSYFTDATSSGSPIDYGRRPVDRWKNCINYLAKLSYENGEIKIEKVGEIDGMYGLLARCQPLVENNRVLLPMYREEDPLCQIWSFNGYNFVKLSEFGEMTYDIAQDLPRSGMAPGSLGNGYAIQPALMKTDGTYYAFCRNVCRPVSPGADDNFKAWVFSSKDCKNWSEVKMSGIPNHNNSLMVVNRGNNDGFVIFSTNRSRKDMILFGTNSKNSIHLERNLTSRRRSSFSYPNAAWDSEGGLHITHTNSGIIAWHYFDKEFLSEAFGDGPTIPLEE